MKIRTITSKDRIVIPLKLREKYHFDTGTTIVFVETNEGILIKLVTAETIKAGRGFLAKPEVKGTALEWKREIE